MNPRTESWTEYLENDSAKGAEGKFHANKRAMTHARNATDGQRESETVRVAGEPVSYSLADECLWAKDDSHEGQAGPRWPYMTC